MTADQLTIVLILTGLFILFLWGRWRYDIVALLGLVVATLTGLVPVNEAFAGFGHPAVITVAAVLVISKALQNGGIVEWISDLLSRVGSTFWHRFLALNLVAMLISGLINNVGALALLLPVGIKLALDHKQPPSFVLMPLAFSTLLGGMTTLIGTPPNIIVASIRGTMELEPYHMFSFTPVGICIAIGGVFFLTFFSRFLLPRYKPILPPDQVETIEDYITEIKVLEESTYVDQTLGQLEASLDGDADVLGVERNGSFNPRPRRSDRIHVGDLLVVRTDPKTLQRIVDIPDVTILSDHKHGLDDVTEGDYQVRELVVGPNSRYIGRNAGSLQLKRWFNTSLLAVSRSGSDVKQRLSRLKLQLGDVLLLRSSPESLQELVQKYGLYPLEERGVRLLPRRFLVTCALFVTTILLIALQYVTPEIGFVGLVLVLHLSKLLPLREIYRSIDLPILVLLGAMLPIGHALETTGVADLAAEGILSVSGTASPMLILALLLIGTMFLSDIINNAAAVVLVLPIATRMAAALTVSVDPFMMGVAIGASCPFLTPIGHQCNALILGPGGYKFSDYWKLGLPLEIIITVIALTVIPIVWPF